MAEEGREQSAHKDKNEHIKHNRKGRERRIIMWQGSKREERTHILSKEKAKNDDRGERKRIWLKKKREQGNGFSPVNEISCN